MQQGYWGRLTGALALWTWVAVNCEGQTVFSGKDWQEATPESQGVDSAKLKAAIAYMDMEFDERIVQ